MKNQLTCGHNHRIKGRGYTDAELEACPILKAMVKAERRKESDRAFTGRKTQGTDNLSSDTHLRESPPL
jgi:hypothetical protein